MSWMRMAVMLAMIAIPGAWEGTSLAQTAVPPGRDQSVRPQAAPLNGRLQAMLESFRGHSTPDQYNELVEAVTASPMLARQLGDLAQAGRLSGFEIATPQRKQTSPFATTIDHGKIVFAGDFLAKVVRKQLFDVVYPDRILPDNLVFVLGSLAFHLQNAGAQVQATPSNMASFVKAHIEQDTRSFIQGWNDVVDAAVRENRDKPLTVQQQGMLILNFRYRAVLVDKDNQHKIAWSPSGAIEPTGQNVAALLEIVSRSRLLDFGVGLGE